MWVEENAVTTALSSPKPEKKKKKKKYPKKKIIFSTKNTTLKNFFIFSWKFILYSKTFFYSTDQPRVDIIKSVLYSVSLYFLNSRKKISVPIL